MEHRHQRSGDASRVGVLDDVAPIDDAGCSLRQHRVGAFEQLGRGMFERTRWSFGEVWGATVCY